jgi:crotonobetainyl-CoA hydratase
VSTSPAVITTEHGHALVVTINQPEARNAVNEAVHVGLGKAIGRADLDPDIRVVVVTGAGDHAFLRWS